MAMIGRGVHGGGEVPPPAAIHPTLGRIKMDKEAETAHWKGEPTDAGEKR
jgi:hypothetical protein